MTARNKLVSAPPYAVEQSIERLGKDLRTARIRRKLTIEDMAAKIGTGPRAVADAEKGKPSTSMVVYAALLWALDLLPQLDEVAIPAGDVEGQALALAREPQRANAKAGLSNDF